MFQNKRFMLRQFLIFVVLLSDKVDAAVKDSIKLGYCHAHKLGI